MLVPVSSAREIGKCQWEVLEPEGIADAKCWWGVPADNSNGRCEEVPCGADGSCQ